jgi:hypothetical protein
VGSLNLERSLHQLQHLNQTKWNELGALTGDLFGDLDDLDFGFRNKPLLGVRDGWVLAGGSIDLLPDIESLDASKINN